MWALGVILYECLAGAKPFAGESAHTVMRRVIEDEPADPRRAAKDLPRELALIALKCLSKDPRVRYPSAKALAADLKRWLAGEPVCVRTVGRLGRAVKWARRRPEQAIAVALGLSALAVGGLLVRAEWLRAELHAEREKLATVGYGRALQLAYQSWRDGNVPAALNLLDGTRPDMRGWEWRHVHRLCRSDLLCTRTLRESATWHSHPVWGKVSWDSCSVRSAAFSPDGRYVATGGVGALQVWDTTDGRRVRKLADQGGSVAVFFTPDGTRVVSVDAVGVSRAIRMWTAGDGKAVPSPTATGDEEVQWAAISRDGSRLALGVGREAVRVVELGSASPPISPATATPLLTSRSAHSDCLGVYSPDGAFVVAPADPGGASTIRPDTGKAPSEQSNGWRVFNGRTGAPVCKLHGRLTAHPTAFSPDGRRLLTARAHGDNRATIWELPAGRRVATITDPGGAVESAVFGPDGNTVLTTAGTAATIWDVAGKSKTTLDAGSLLAGAVFGPSSGQIVVTDTNAVCGLWDVTTRRAVTTVHGLSQNQMLSVLSPDGRRLATVGQNDLQLWDAERRNPLVLPKAATELWANAVGFTTDGSSVWVAGQSRVRFHDVTTVGKVREVSVPGEFNKPSGLSRDGRRAVGFTKITATVVDVATGKPVRTFDGFTGTLSQVVLTPDGERVVTITLDGDIRVWDVATGAVTRSAAADLTPPSGERSSLAGRASDDGSNVLVQITRQKDGKPDYQLVSWDTNTGRKLWSVAGSSVVSVMRFTVTADGARIVHTAGVLDSRSGAGLAVFRTDPASALAVAVSPDGTRAVVGCNDGTARLFDTQSGAEVLSLRGQTNGIGAVADGIGSVAYSPDGRRIVTAAWDGTILVHDSAPVSREFLDSPPAP